MDTASRQAIDTFYLREHWQRLLRQIWLKNGEESAEWQKNTAVVDQLPFSVQPKVDIEERKRLAPRPAANAAKNFRRHAAGAGGGARLPRPKCAKS